MKTKTAEETKKIAEDFARGIMSSPLSGETAFIIALKGDLGGGKTTFLQGFAKGLGIKENITSPTFNIFKKYPIQSRPSLLYHFDCYRIEDKQEILNLGFEKIISDPKNIVVIEWAENIKDILPKNIKWVNFTFVDDTTRTLDFK